MAQKIRKAAFKKDKNNLVTVLFTFNQHLIIQL